MNLLSEWLEPKGWTMFTESEAKDLGPQALVRGGPMARPEDHVQISEELLALQEPEIKAMV